jgi:hypothetical protein
MPEREDNQQSANHETVERLSREVERLRTLLELQAIKSMLPRSSHPSQLTLPDPE